MSNNVNAPENLRVKVSKFKTDLSFNEWTELLNVSSGYIPPTPYFTGNAKNEYASDFEKRDPILSRIADSLAELIKSIPTPF